MEPKIHHHHHLGSSDSNNNYCPVENRRCVSWWVEKYFKDCLCNLRDEISFGLGIVSLICWGFAEIPQIITNFHTKSAAGLSLSFLLTWIVGDIFNLVGCVLDPATLPTQFFTALLYTTTTVALVFQCIYYEHFLRWWHSRDNELLPNVQVIVEDEKESLLGRPPKSEHQFVRRRGGPYRVPVATAPRHFYFMSGRTLASSDTPPRCSYIKPRSGPPALINPNYSSNSDEEDNDHARAPSSSAAITQPRSIPRPTAYGTFLAAAAHCAAGSRAAAAALQAADGVTAGGMQEENGADNLGQWLGWLMAAIYMGGRIPQIWLNMKRGSIEGLNPLMFIFVLVANATYFASILVRSMEWEKINANMAWLVDAVACVVLDLFIILQYLYYSRLKTKKKKIQTPFY